MDEGELVPVTDAGGKTYQTVQDEWSITLYRPRIEGSFARIEYHCQNQGTESYWKIVSGNNVTTVYGRGSAARIANPADARQVFCWMLEEMVDPNGNRIRYHYKSEDGEGVPPELLREGACNSYLDHVEYGNYFLDEEEYFAFRVQLQYSGFDPINPTAAPGPWEVRPDPFSTFLSGFEVRNYRLCKAILVYHQFQGQHDNAPVLASALHLTYTWDHGTDLSFLTQATQWGYRINSRGAYEYRSLPALDLHYHNFQPNGHSFRHLQLEGNTALPDYLWNGTFAAADLYSEGLPGFLLSNEQTTLYWEPMGEGIYRGPIVPEAFPLNKDLQQPNIMLTDLESNGYKSLVTYQQGIAGYHAASHQGQWAPFVAFEENALELAEPEAAHVDLTGDGLADLVIFDGPSIRWYPSLGTKGHGKAHECILPAGFPATNNNAKEVLLTFADFNGDGLADYVRIANGEVQYWPGSGYGHFGEVVQMQGAPIFSNGLDIARLHLADIDGSGTNDIIYMEYDRAVIWFNRSGNDFSAPMYIPLPFTFDNISEVNFVDVLGNGTNCMILTRIEPEVEHLYYDFSGGHKCYLMNRVENNAGARHEIHYGSTVQQYLADKRAGRVDASRLFFPVQVVTRHVIIDQISHALHVSKYAYHDGYFDPEERVFRGFGFVESWDTDHYQAFEATARKLDFTPDTLNEELHVSPAYTKSWYHTGAFAKSDVIEAQYRKDYYQGDQEARSIPSHSFSPAFEQADAETYRQGYAALEGQLLRQEVYGLDGSDKENDPFSISETHVHVRLVQPRYSNRYAVIFPFANESITWNYERDPADPQIAHSFALETDAYGNTLRSATVSYPRRPQPDKCVFPEQGITHMVLNETAYATLIRDEPDEAQQLRTCRWTGMAYEHTTYQVKTAGLPAGQLSFEEVADWVTSALQNPIPYHQTFDENASPEARLLGQDRTYFWNEDQTKAGALGELSYHNLSHHDETAIGTAEFYTSVFGDKLDNDLMTNDSGYVLQDGMWWSHSPVTFYLDQPEQFYLPSQTVNTAAKKLPPDSLTGVGENTLYTKSTIAYDPYYLFNTAVSAWLSDTIELTTTAEIDYQALQPWRATDPNQNIHEVLFDPLGQVIVASTYGQLQGKPVGNSPVSDYQPIAATFEQVLENPQVYLQQANNYYYYDLHAWTERRQPVRSVALVGEKFSSQLTEQEENIIQVAVAYNDGFGRAIEVKQKADAGPVKMIGTVALTHEPVGPGSSSGERWTVSGRTVYNNKGLPAQQYLPYFSATPDYEDQQAIEMESLVPPPSVIQYDALDRAVRTDDPKGFYSRVKFTPWKTETFDPNDTVAGSSYFQKNYNRLPEHEKDALDKALRCTHTPSVQIMDNLGRVTRNIQNNLGIVRLAHLKKLATQHQTTAAALFSQLVALGILDLLEEGADEGVLSEATLHWNEDLLNRITSQFGPLSPGLLELLYNGRMTTLQVYDIQGRTLLSMDPRLYYYNLIKGDARYNFRYTYNMTGETLHTRSCDAGEAWVLNNLFGLPVCSWDNRGFVIHACYDRLQRPLLRQVMGGDGTFSLNNITQKTIYGESDPDAIENNLMGQAIQSYDEAGLATVSAYSLNNQPLAVVQQLRADYTTEANWTPDACVAVAKEEQFITATETDALGRPIRQITPDGNVCEPTYNQSGYFKAMYVALGKEAPQAIVNNVEYDAQGKPAQIDYGNDISTRYDYEVSTQRLIRLRSYRRSATPDKDDLVQDLRYWYDPVGNVSTKIDHSWSTVFSANQQVDPQNNYVYDPLYRLTRATGRQLAYTGAVPPDEKWLVDRGIGFRTANPNDPNQLENYIERYAYDLAGNLTGLQHSASHSWSSRLTISPDSNRLAGTAYDGNGNTRSLEHLQNLRWDYRNNLAAANIVTRKEGLSDAEYYLYSSGGVRLRKVNERLAANGSVEITDTLYLGNYERKTISVRQSENTPPALLQRNTLKVDGPGSTVCLIHHWPVDVRNRETSREGQRQFRYQLDDTQGSVSLELNEKAQLITYEEYFPYGNTAFTVEKNQVEVQLKTYRYSGQERDATGLYYYGARYYPPWLCRWLNPDPGGTIDGLNLFTFVSGNPVTKVDVGGYGGNSATEEPKKTASAKPRNQALVQKGAANRRAAKRKWTAVASEGSSTGSSAPPRKRRFVKTDDGDVSDSDTEEFDRHTSNPRKKKSGKNLVPQTFTQHLNERRTRNVTKWATKRGIRPDSPIPNNKFEKKDLALHQSTLKDDVRSIHDKIPKTGKDGKTNRSYGATTIATAIIKDNKNDIYKKYAFSNTEIMAVGLREKAESLGYHVIQTGQSHAEAEYYLYMNSRKHFEHIDMAVDKPHCAECVEYADHFIGKNFQTQTEKSNKIFTNYHGLAELEAAGGFTSLIRDSKTAARKPRTTA
ncbi:hypothetical protein GCM10023143_22080 [Compostibacter hankyongensis]|uniref:Insecticidal toxin complex protein n=1 Tax=Compostibacter hankyongensis TaxID=1007089 RepID=A0ABP8FWF3_9BACT